MKHHSLFQSRDHVGRFSGGRIPFAWVHSKRASGGRIRRADGGQAQDPNDMTNMFNTPLQPGDEAKFQAWAASNPRLGNTYDYDSRGFWKAGAGTADNGHGSDQWKKPNHPTFSDQSQYSGAGNYQGGKWNTLPDGSWSFVPSSTNLQMNDVDDLRDYFAKQEPGNSLILPSEPRASGGRVAMADGGVPVFDDNSPAVPVNQAPTFAPDSAALPLSNTPDQGALSAFGHGAASGATFGFSDEMAGLRAAAPQVAGHDIPDVIPTPVGAIPARMMAGAARLAKQYVTGESDASDAYAKARDEERNAQQVSQEQHPWIYGAGEVAGSLPTMVAAPEIGGVIKGAGPAANIARGMVTGAGYGGFSGLGEGTDLESRLQNAGRGILAGTAMGAGLAGVGEGVDKALSKIPVKPKTLGVVKQPETEAFSDAAENNYANMRGYGVEIHPTAMNRVADNITTELLAEGYRPRNAPKVFDAVEELRNPAGQNHEISDIDSVRKVLGKARLDPSERDAARRAIGHIDDYLANLGQNPQDVVVNPQYAGRVGSEAVEARANYAASKRSEQIDEALDKAERQAGRAGSGGNINNAIRQQLSWLRNNSRKMAGWTDAEKVELDSVINGTKGANLARKAGKFAPEGIVSTVMSAGMGHAISPGVGTVAIPGIGLIAKKIGDRMTRAAAERLQNVVKARSPLGKQVTATAQAALPAPVPRGLPVVVRNSLPALGVPQARIHVGRLPLLQGPVPSRADNEQP